MRSPLNVARAWADEYREWRKVASQPYCDENNAEVAEKGASMNECSMNSEDDWLAIIEFLTHSRCVLILQALDEQREWYLQQSQRSDDPDIEEHLHELTAARTGLANLMTGEKSDD